MTRRGLHSVWKSQKKSHSTLRAKRATFTFWVDKSWLKMPKMVHFGEFLKTCSLRSNSVTRQVNFKSTKIGEKCTKLKNIKWDILGDFQTMCSSLDFLTNDWFSRLIIHCSKYTSGWERQTLLKLPMQEKPNLLASSAYTIHKSVLWGGFLHHYVFCVKVSLLSDITCNLKQSSLPS